MLRIAFSTPISLVTPTSVPVDGGSVCTSRQVVTMLKVRKSRRAEAWGNKDASVLSGRFLPLDPREEVVLNALEEDPHSYGSEGPPSSAYSGAGEPARPKTWNTRAEAAKRRWQDPEYRAKMLAKRQSTKQRRNSTMEIGAMESITLCDDERAKEINDYVRSNKLRSEKITFYHRNRKAWMDARLEDGQVLRNRTNSDEYKRAAQERRSRKARERHQRKRQRELELEADAAAPGDEMMRVE